MMFKDYLGELEKQAEEAEKGASGGQTKTAASYPADVLGDKTIPFNQKRNTLKQYMKEKSKETPIGVGAGAGIGALVGGGTGALMGATMGGGKGALAVGAGGAAVGGLIGAINALVDENRVDEAKALAKSKNIDPAVVRHIAQRRKRHHFQKEMRTERRHQESLR